MAEKQIEKVGTPLRPFDTTTQADSWVSRHRASGRRGSIVQVFQSVDMRYQHEGLEILAKQANIDVNKLEPGQYVVFINQAKTIVRLYAAHGVVAGIRLRDGQKVDMRTIHLIPEAFNGTNRLDYDKVLKKAVEEALVRKANRAMGKTDDYST
jgi:hypothetical protein